MVSIRGRFFGFAAIVCCIYDDCLLSLVSYDIVSSFLCNVYFIKIPFAVFEICNFVCNVPLFRLGELCIMYSYAVVSLPF